MDCTIITFPDSHQELYFGVQHLTGLEARVYELSEKQVDLIRTCTSEDVQSILYGFTQTCKLKAVLPPTI